MPFGKQLVALAERIYSADSARQWARIVMNRATRELILAMHPEQLEALEISGGTWNIPGFFRSYKQAFYPEYNVCETVLGETFDLIIAEQVFEHLLWPYRAGKHVHQMLKPGGHFLITTPFLLKVHPAPHDCSRWTETGLRYFLAECGFPLETIATGSWGNRSCIKANFSTWKIYRWWHSLRNEPDFPVVVWALAKK